MSFPKPGRCYSRHAKSKLPRVKQMVADVRHHIERLDRFDRLRAAAAKMKRDVREKVESVK
jgi:hypothetical protein